jgi:hypothetical protein
MIDEEVAVEKLRHVHQYTDDLKQMRGQSKQTYLDDMVTQRAIERTFMNLIQACVDLANHIRSAEGLAPNGHRNRQSKRSGTLASSLVRYKHIWKKQLGFVTSLPTDTEPSITTRFMIRFIPISTGSNSSSRRSPSGSNSANHHDTERIGAKQKGRPSRRLIYSR